MYAPDEGLQGEKPFVQHCDKLASEDYSTAGRHNSFLSLLIIMIMPHRDYTNALRRFQLFYAPLTDEITLVMPISLNRLLSFDMSNDFPSLSLFFCIL